MQSIFERTNRMSEISLSLHNLLKKTGDEDAARLAWLLHLDSATLAEEAEDIEIKLSIRQKVFKKSREKRVMNILGDLQVLSRMNPEGWPLILRVAGNLK